MHQAIEYAQYKAQRIKELLSELNKPSVKVLDFGCGNGLMTYYLQEVFFEAKVIGADQSKETIIEARKEYPDIEFQPIKNNKLSFTDNYFDLVAAADVFHHIPFDQHQRWIKELTRVLKPGGFFIMLELNPLNPFTYWEFKKNPHEKDAHLLWPWYAKRLLNGLGKSQFFPFVAKLPFSSFYAVLLKVKN